VPISHGGTLLRTHRARHDKFKKFGALGNPGGRPRRADDVANEHDTIDIYDGIQRSAKAPSRIR
jgi:hypothetical protein